MGPGCITKVPFIIEVLIRGQFQIQFRTVPCRKVLLMGGHRGVGVAEMAWSMRLGRAPRASKEMGLHTLELLTGLDVASEKGCTYTMTSTFDQPRPLPTGYPMEELGGFLRADAEMALTF